MIANDANDSWESQPTIGVYWLMKMIAGWWFLTLVWFPQYFRRSSWLTTFSGWVITTNQYRRMGFVPTTAMHLDVLQQYKDVKTKAVG